MSASFGRLLGGKVDLLGDVAADLRWPAGPSSTWRFSLRTRTVILEVTRDVSFRVAELDHRIEIGAGWCATGGPRLAAFAGEIGQDQVDLEGRRFAQYVAVALESPGHDRSNRVESTSWQLALGPVLRHRAVDASAFIRGALSHRARKGGLRWGAGLAVEGLLGGDDAGLDVTCGPELGFGWSGDREAALFVRYVSANSAVGPRTSGTLVGLSVVHAGRRVAERAGGSAVHGHIAAGGGQGRSAGRLKASFASPDLGPELSVIIEIDANVLSAPDAGELFYRLFGGLEQRRGSWLAGVYVYHRSNHRLGRANSTVTSNDVIEAGWETAHWDRPAPDPPLRRWGRLEWRLRAGGVLQTSFDRDRRWRLRGGARWEAALAGRSVLFAATEAEAGDVASRTGAVGVRFGSGLDLRLEARADDQYYGQDRTALLLLVGLHL